MNRTDIEERILDTLYDSHTGHHHEFNATQAVNRLTDLFIELSNEPKIELTKEEQKVIDKITWPLRSFLDGPADNNYIIFQRIAVKILNATFSKSLH